MGSAWITVAKALKDKSHWDNAAEGVKGSVKVAWKVRSVQFPDVRVAEQILHDKEFTHWSVLAGVLSTWDAYKQWDDDDLGGHGDERDGDAGE